MSSAPATTKEINWENTMSLNDNVVLGSKHKKIKKVLANVISRHRPVRGCVAPQLLFPIQLQDPGPDNV